MTNPLLLKYPIVLIHGLGARASYGPVDYFYGLPQRLREAGNTVFIPKLTPWHSIDTRARQLKEQIQEFLAAQAISTQAESQQRKINLIGHSLGGLDARYVAADRAHGPYLGDQVASITTIGTPNRGSLTAELALGKLPGLARSTAEQIAAKLGSSFGAFEQVTRASCEAWNLNETADQPGVAYFSATSANPKNRIQTSLPVFWLTEPLIRAQEGENDGFVSVESAKWGELITVATGDHYGQIGQWLGRSRGLDYVKFQNQILARLKREGF